MGECEKKNETKSNNYFEYLLILYVVVSPVSISATNIVLALITITGFIRLYQTRGDEIVFQPKLIAIALMLFLWAAFTALMSKGYVVKKDISNIWAYSPILLLPIFLQRFQANKERVVMTLLFFSSLVCLLGILQYMIPSINYPFPKQLVRGTFRGFFSHHLHTGGFYSMITILSFTLILFWQSKRRIKILLCICFALSLLALLLSEARSYYLSLLCVVPVILLVKNMKYFIAGFLFFVIAVVLLFSFSNPVKDRIETIWDMEHPSNKARIYIWKAAIEMFKDNPLTGIGRGNWKKEAIDNYYPRFEGEWQPAPPTYAHAHNSYLMWLAETGIVGLLLFLSFWISVECAILSQGNWKLDGSFNAALEIGTLGALNNLFVAGLFENNFGTSIVLLLISFLVGLSLGRCESKTKFA